MIAIGNGIGLPFLKNGGGGAPAPNPDFISVWDTTKAGSASDTVILPLLSGGTYSGTIDWGDGNSDSLSYANRQHTYASGGVYTITISGQIDGWEFNFFSSDEEKILEVQNWGNLTITSSNGFYSCGNLTITATDAPTFTTTSIERLFYQCTSLTTPDLSQFDTSGVTNMDRVFAFCTNFNSDISMWDVSSVTSFEASGYGMFANCTNFNQPLNSWNVSSANNMASMFLSATNFNQPLDNWDVSSVTNMNQMFRQAKAFNQPLNDWDVSSVTNMSQMFNMFGGGGSPTFNQPLNNWNVSSVTDMSNMFNNCTSFNQDIGNWNVSSVTDMERMFQQATSFDQDISGWNIVNVSNFTNFMRYISLSTVNYDAILIGWEATLQAAYPSGVGYPHTINIHFGGSQYTAGGSADAARTSLISNFGWTITDGGSV